MVIESCSVCPRNCKAKRTEECGSGFCGMGALPVVSRAMLHHWEEPCISGAKGSGAVFFTGCSLKCVFCQNYEISTEKSVGKVLQIEELNELFFRLVEQGAQNINLVNPTHFAPAICEALQLRHLPVPVVYNSGGYETVETLQKMEGLVDIYLPDLKYAAGTIAGRYSGAEDYVEFARSAILEMVRQTGPVQFDEDGMLLRGTVIRHLILPGHTRESMGVLDWIKQELDGKVLVSLMAQYLPYGKAEKYPEINRRITPREYRKVEDYLFSLDLDGFVQKRSSAKETYIPSFCLEELEGLGHQWEE